MNHSRGLLLPVQPDHLSDSIPILIRSGLGMGANTGGGGRKMGKITVRNKAGEEKDWVDGNGKMFEDIREGMFEDMCLDEMIQWVEQKLKERQ